MFISDSLLGDFIGVVVTLLVILIFYLKWTYLHWWRRGVPYLEAQIPYGNFAKAVKGQEHIGVSQKKIYDLMRRKGWKYGGIFTFTKPKLLVTDLDIMRNMLTKDFQYFVDRDFYYNEKDPLQAHLLNLSGTKWRNMRAKLTPTFTSGKMKMMFGVMAECQNDLQQRLDRECEKNEAINIKEILACFTTNIIGSAAFGLDFKALQDEDSEFRQMGRIMFQSSRWKRFKRMFSVTFPEVAKFLDLSLANREVANFVMNMVQKTMDYRKKNNVERNDFMQLMINLKNNKPTNPGDHDGKPLTMDEVASQCVVFFGAGFETSSTLMTFTLYELAKNQHIQNKLRSEINAVLARHNNEITYDSIQDIAYLNQVIDESLRIHPPAAQTSRKCVKDYKIPNEDVIIDKGTIVSFSILGIHHDPEIYPDPARFDPERFSEENKKKRHNYAHLPFGEGPRNCIGMRFGLLQAKMGLVALIKNFKFTVHERTQEPLVYNPNNIVLSAVGEVWLSAKRI